MENLMEALRIVAASWPVAAMVVGVTTGIVVRRSMYQAMNNDRLEKIERAKGNQAVVVHGRHRDDD